MHTQCPHCQTIFRVTAAHLNIAQGHVRCSHCQHVFNASNYLQKQSPNQATLKSFQSFQIDDNQVVTDLSDLPEYDIPELLKEDIYEPPRGRTWRSFFFWGIMVILLAAMVTVQTMWFWQRDSLLQHPQIRPWLNRFCYTFLCRLPPTRNLGSFEMQNVIARIHPKIKDAIRFEAVFTNKALFPQPYPDVQLTFEDANSNPIAQRRFKPAEYLPHSPLKNEQMDSKASIHLKLDLIEMDKVIEEGEIASGYRFEFF